MTAESEQRQRVVDLIIEYESLLEFSSALHPQNVAEQKEKFLQGAIENPVFTYKNLNLPPVDFPELDSSVPLAGFYKDRMNLTIMLADLLRSVGDDDAFVTRSAQVFPVLDVELPPVKYTTSKDTGPRLNSRDIAERFEAALHEYGLEDWSVQVLPDISSRMFVNQWQQVIGIRRNVKASAAEVERLVKHEIGVHVVRAANGRRQTEPLLHVGTRRGRLFEEGVACYIENPKGPKRIFTRHQIVRTAQAGSFRDTWQSLLDLGISEQTAWVMTLRVKRGLQNTAFPGAFTRDALYAQAFMDMKKYMEAGGKLPPLLSAPIHHEEVQILQAKAGLKCYPALRMDLADKHALMVGYRGKKTHLESAKAQGVRFDLLVDASEMQPEYALDFEAVHVLEDIFDWRQIEPILRQKKYDAVFTRLEDFTVLVSAIADYQILPGVAVDDALKFRNKHLMRQAFARHGVPSADFALVQSVDDARDFLKKHRFPLILKQISGIHSKYVAKVHDEAELAETIDYFLKSLAQENGTLHGQLHHYLKTLEAPDHFKYLLLEEFIVGEELTVDAFVVDGKVYHTPVCRYTMPEELGIQDHHLPIRTMPYDLEPDELKLVHNVVEQSLHALGANYCVTHVEVFLDRENKNCSLIEVAARGGGFRAEMVQETCGGDYDLGLIRSAFALPPNVANEPHVYCAVAEVFAPASGRLRAIDTNCLVNQPDVSHITWNKKHGEEVGRAADGRSFILKFLVKADSYEAVESRSQELLLKVRESIVIDDQ